MPSMRRLEVLELAGEMCPRSLAARAGGTHARLAVCSGYLDSLNDASPQLQRSWQGLGRVLTPLSTRAGHFRAVMTAVKTTNTSPHACYYAREIVQAWYTPTAAILNVK